MSCNSGTRGGRVVEVLGRVWQAGFGIRRDICRLKEVTKTAAQSEFAVVLMFFTTNALGQRKSGCTEASQAPLQAPVRVLPSLPSARRYDCPTPSTAKNLAAPGLLSPPMFLARRIATKHTNRAHSLRLFPPPMLWEKVPGQRSLRPHF